MKNITNFLKRAMSISKFNHKKFPIIICEECQKIAFKKFYYYETDSFYCSKCKKEKFSVCNSCGDTHIDQVMKEKNSKLVCYKCMYK